jgi:hypothetical protein
VALFSRQELVNRTRERLLRESAPRVQLAIIVGLAGLAAFICSAVAVRFGIPWMAVGTRWQWLAGTPPSSV